MRTERVCNEIHYPEEDSEFEVQAELWRRLKGMQIDVRGCVRAWCKDGVNENKVFFDLVVFDDLQNAVAIIECKNWSKNATCVELRPETRQSRRYSKFKVPLILCRNRDAIETAINKILDACEVRSVA